MLWVRGIAFLAAKIYYLFNSLNYGWNWMIPVPAATPGGMGRI